jgi:hypothetical protein
MVDDQLIILLNIELANDIIRGVRVKDIKRRPMEQIT